MNDLTKCTGALAYDPEQIVIAWIEGEANPPHHLAATLQRYRDLTIYRDAIDDDPVELDRSMNAIFDKLIIAAEAQIHISAKAEAQLRRIQRRNMARWTFQQRCDWACEQYRKGVRFTAND